MDSHRIIPESAASKEQIEEFINQVAGALENDQLNTAIFHLFRLHHFIEKNIKPYIGKGKRLATDKEIYDFSCSDAIQLIAHDFPGLEKQYNDKIIKNGAIMMELLQTCLNDAACKEDKNAITKLSIASTMFKLFAGATSTNFCKADVDLETEVDPLAKKLDLDAIIKPLLPGYLSFFSTLAKPDFYKPVAMAQQVYVDYLSPFGENIRKSILKR